MGQQSLNNIMVLHVHKRPDYLDLDVLNNFVSYSEHRGSTFGNFLILYANNSIYIIV